MGARAAAADVAVLAGAGVSVGAGLPAAIPLAQLIIHELVEDPTLRSQLLRLLPGRARQRHARDVLRFEVLLGEVRERYDPNLELLAFLDSAVVPSPLQGQLALLGVRGASLLTVNFDDLLERAINDAGRSPVTVDVHSRRLAVIGDRIPVYRLHGTRLRHDATGVRRAEGLPHADLTIIGAANPGTRLKPRAARRLRDLLRDRLLLVVGYSASDAFDVVPALYEARPRSVIWIQYARTEPRRARHALRTAAPDAARLMDHWAARGSDVQVWSGDPVQLVRQRLAVDPPQWPRPQVRWRAHVRDWAAQARSRPGHHRGLPLACNLLFDATRVAQVHAALKRFRPQHRAGGDWSRVEYELMRAEVEFLRRGGDPREAERRARWVAATASDADDRARALILVGRIRSIQPSQAEDAAAALSRAAKIATRGSPIRADALNFLAQARRYGASQPRWAAAAAAEALELYRRHGLYSGISDASYQLGLARRRQGRYAEAERALRVSVVHASRVGLTHQLFSSRATLGEVMVDRGRTRAGATLIANALDEARRDEGWPAEGWAAALVLARAHLEFDDPATASAVLRDALGRRESTKRYMRVDLELALAEALLATGDRPGALAALRRAERRDPSVREENAEWWVMRMAMGELDRMDVFARRLRHSRHAVSAHVDVCAMACRLLEPEARLRPEVTRAAANAAMTGNRRRVKRFERWLAAIA
jgi:tetratricopeptide (TPR) repeat protein